MVQRHVLTVKAESIEPSLFHLNLDTLKRQKISDVVLSARMDA